MDFGPSAADYALHRQGFPPSFFERVRLSGRVLDLGSGTGSLATGFAAQGAQVVALDRSHAMLAAAPQIAWRVVARAERCPFASNTFDAIVAGQCWHWFDGPAVARECHRLLVPGGRLVIAHFDYLGRPDNAAGAAERLILARNPKWPWAGSNGIYDRWRPHLESAGFTNLASWFQDVQVRFIHDGWRV